MKRLFTEFMILVLISIGVQGQTPDTLKKTRYGVELNQFITGSGFATGTEIYITVIPDHKKNISLGLYFCPDAKRITGITVHHEMALLRNSAQRKIVPYAFYNMIYRFTRVKEANADSSLKVGYATYKSLEHHLGIGIRINLIKDVYLNSALGYGVYLGSIKKHTKPDAVTGELTGGNGFGAIAKIGVAFVF
ncbi:MAG: hypothetical protein JXB49_25710 [Bacteroidales bacterium]|nr:hypothetical protein [Bacteroidales bacterium]